MGIQRQEIILSTTAKTFGQVREEWVADRKLRQTTAGDRDTNLANYAQVFERKKITDVNDKLVLSRWLNGLRSVRTGGELSSGSKVQILAAVSDVLRYAVKQRYITHNAARDLDREDRPRQGRGTRRRILSHDEEERLLLYSANFPWLRAIVIVARAQCLRLGEVLGLQWEDIDFVAGTIRIHQQLSRDGRLVVTKGARPETGKLDVRDENPIPLLPEAREALLELRIDSDGTGFVFRNLKGGPRNYKHTAGSFVKAVKYAALPVTAAGRVTFHTLRHTGISRLVNGGCDVTWVKEFAGHADLAVTLSYSHVDPDRAERNRLMAEAAMVGGDA